MSKIMHEDAQQTDVKKIIISSTVDGLSDYFSLKQPELGRHHTGFLTIPYESSFLLLSADEEENDPTIYQYDSAEEEFHPLPVNMTKPLCELYPIDPWRNERRCVTPMLVDLDMFPACTVDRP